MTDHPSIVREGPPRWAVVPDVPGAPSAQAASALEGDDGTVRPASRP